MLVLSRKESQRIRLGDDIVVTVVRVAGDKVRLGIEAPSSVVVLRDELESHADLDWAVRPNRHCPFDAGGRRIAGNNDYPMRPFSALTAGRRFSTIRPPIRAGN